MVTSPFSAILLLSRIHFPHHYLLAPAPAPAPEKKVFHSKLQKAIEVNNELTLKVDEQQDDLKYLREKCDIDDEDKVQEITAGRTPMTKSLNVYHVIKRLQLKISTLNISRKST